MEIEDAEDMGLQKFKIIFPIEVYQKLRAYVNAVNTEISGFGKIKLSEDRTIFTVEDVKIFEQDVSGAHTRMDAKAISKFYNELMDKGEDPSNWKLWWHSHADMDAFFSSTDTNTIDDFDNEMPAENWMLSLVTNFENKSEIRLDIFYPFRVTFGTESFVTDFSCTDPKFLFEIAKEVAEKVNPKRNEKKFFGFMDKKEKVHIEIMGEDGRPITGGDESFLEHVDRMP